MDFGLQKEEIESLARQAFEEGRKEFPWGDGLESGQPVQVTHAIVEVVTQNNARILEALTNAGIRL